MNGRRSGDRAAYELDPYIIEKIKGDTYKTVRLLKIIGIVGAVILLIVTVVTARDEFSGSEISGAEIGIFIAAFVFKFGILFLMDGGMFLLANFVGKRSAKLDDGNFTFRVAMVIDKERQHRHEGSDSHYLIFEDAEFGVPEKHSVDFKQYNRTEIGDYVHIVYIERGSRGVLETVLYHDSWY